MTRQAVHSLLRALKVLLDGMDHPPLRQFMTDWPTGEPEIRDLAPRPLPVLRWLEAARRNGPAEASAVLQFLCNHAEEQFWSQTYSIADFGEAFLENYGWFELIGQRGPIDSDKIACGFLMLGPDTEYPHHSHEAEEVYLTLSGPSHWMRIGSGDWSRLPPLQPVHFIANQPHGFQTGKDPLVAIYFWRGGDLVQKARIG